MASGQWDLTLDPATPKSIRDLLTFFGHVYTFDSPPRPGQSDATMIASSRWGGVVRTRPTPWSVGGPNMISWLGDEDGKGDLIEAALGPTNTTFTAWITAIINSQAAIHTGSVVAAGANKSFTFQWITPRTAIETICSVWGYEYRVNKDCTIDAGSPTFLGYKITPTAVAMRRSSGRDQNIVGISTTQLDVSIDAEDYITRSIVHDGTGAYTATAGTATPYLDFYGNLVNITKIFEEPNTPAAQAAAQGAVLVAAGQVLHNEVAITTDEFDIDRDVVVGDNMYVYDEDGSMKDLPNQIHYRGSLIYPIILRVMAITWPIEKSMSVWYRSGSAAWTDLTNYVQWEAPGATLEVGAPIRPLTKT